MLTNEMKGAIVSNKVENFQWNEREGPHGSKTASVPSISFDRLEFEPGVLKGAQ